MALFGVGNGDDIEEMLFAPEGHRPARLRFTKHDSLLDAATHVDRCANATSRAGLWARFDTQWLEFKIDVQEPFLNALGAICKGAQLQRCQADACIELRRQVGRAVPECEWAAFREWAAVAMACQYRMGYDQELPPHVHIASAVGLMNTLLETHYDDQHDIDGALLGPRGQGMTLDVGGVADVVYWMLTVQTKMDRNTVDLEAWPRDYIPPALVQPAIGRAEQRAAELGLCLFRVHTLAAASSRKAAELPAIVAAVDRSADLVHPGGGHEQCTAGRCRFMYRDNTGRTPLHNAPAGTACHCRLRSFSHGALSVAVAEGRPAVWSCQQRDTLDSNNNNYMAISHTWADGTGAHPDHPGSVNGCMFDFFAAIAARLGCVGLWWDAISIPAKRNDAALRAKAISNMHHNYAQASYTVVHDRYLRRFRWREGDAACRDDACLAIALSPWFSRGWTSLELHVSHKVVVLFGSPRASASTTTNTNTNDPSDTVVIQLLSDILSKHPALSPRAHWVAALLINKVWRKHIQNVSEILAILHPRGTSWPSDTKLIQAHLAGCGDNPDLAMEENEAVFTRRVLGTVGSVLRSALLHGFETLAPSGPFSWCPRALSDMPISSSDDFEGPIGDHLDIHPDGYVTGTWHWRSLEPNDAKPGALVLHQPPLLRHRTLNDKQKAYRLEQGLSRTPPQSVLSTALRDWNQCLLLREAPVHNVPTILVQTLRLVKDKKEGRIIDCRYIATVEERQNALEYEDYKYDTIRLGHPEAGAEGVDMRDLIHEGSDDDLGDSDSEEMDSEKSEDESTGDEEAGHQPKGPHAAAGTPLAIQLKQPEIQTRVAEKKLSWEQARYVYLFGLEAPESFLHHNHLQNSEELVRLLLANDRTDPNARDENGNTPLLWAVKYSHVEVVKLLLISDRVDLHLKDNSCRTPLMYALSYGEEQIARLLLASHRIDPNLGSDVYTPLSWAVQNNHDEMVKLLLANDRTDLDVKPGNYELLYWAINNGHDEIVQLLLANDRFDPSAKGNGLSPLLLALLKKSEPAVMLLLESDRVDPNVTDETGTSPLIKTVKREHEELVKVLLASPRIDPNLKDNRSRTPLTWAVKIKHEGIVRLLMADNRVDPNIKDDYGETPLWKAARYKGSETILKLLLASNRVHPNLADDGTGKSPLLAAVHEGNEKAVKLLLTRKDVNINFVGGYGWTALLTAERFGHKAIAMMLRQHGAT